MAEADQAVLTLAAALLPGGAGFPPFATTDAGPLLLQRLSLDDRARLAALTDSAGGIDAAAGVEAAAPTLFAELRKQAYLAYYEQPPVIAAIRALGHPYNDAPLPDGYPAEPFDPARDAPRHGRGRWIDTDDVLRVDLTGLVTSP